MKKAMLAASLAVAGTVFASQAFATTYAIPLQVDNGIYSGGLTEYLPSSGPFTDDFTFTIPNVSSWDAGASFTVVTTPSQIPLLPSLTLTLYKGAVGSGVSLASDAMTKVGVSGIASVDYTGLSGGPYYVELTGTSNRALSYSVDVTLSDPVPELQTWAMLGLGFAGMAFVAFRSQKGARYAL